MINIMKKHVSKKTNAENLVSKGVNMPKIPSRYKKFMLSKKFLVGVSCISLITFVVILSLPKTYEKSEFNLVSYSIQNKDENSIELGQNKTAEEGKNGIQRVKYKYTQSLLGYIFSREKATKTLVESKIVSEPTSKIVLNGTKKWQYMMCTDGSSRYYTDEQFKDRNTGFTNASPDYCAQNNQGVKLSLADYPNGNADPIKPTYVSDSCSIVDIPYSTVYKNVDWLYIGETQEGNGYNGYKQVCPNITSDLVSNPIDKVVYRGTKERTQVPTYTNVEVPTGPTPNVAAKQKCDSDYSYAKARIVIAGASGSSAMSQLQRLHSQCLRSAGY